MELRIKLSFPSKLLPHTTLTRTRARAHTHKHTYSVVVSYATCRLFIEPRCLNIVRYMYMELKSPYKSETETQTLSVVVTAICQLSAEGGEKSSISVVIKYNTRRLLDRAL